MAYTWAAGCAFVHGQPPVKKRPFRLIGQNLYMSSRRTDPAAAVRLWYNEKKHYRYDTNQCARGKVCGHYTQVQCITSRLLGRPTYLSADLGFTTILLVLLPSSSIFLFFQLPSELAERNSTKIGHMLWSACDLKMHVRNLGYSLPLKS